MIAFRLLVTEPLDGATNMALDEALLQARLAKAEPPDAPVLRVGPPTISLGHGQRSMGASISRHRRRWESASSAGPRAAAPSCTKARTSR